MPFFVEHFNVILRKYRGLYNLEFNACRFSTTNSNVTLSFYGRWFSSLRLHSKIWESWYSFIIMHSCMTLCSHKQKAFLFIVIFPVIFVWKKRKKHKHIWQFHIIHFHLCRFSFLNLESRANTFVYLLDQKNKA